MIKLEKLGSSSNQQRTVLVLSNGKRRRHRLYGIVIYLDVMPEDVRAAVCSALHASDSSSDAGSSDASSDSDTAPTSPGSGALTAAAVSSAPAAAASRRSAAASRLRALLHQEALQLSVAAAAPVPATADQHAVDPAVLTLEQTPGDVGALIPVATDPAAFAQAQMQLHHVIHDEETAEVAHDLLAGALEVTGDYRDAAAAVRSQLRYSAPGRSRVAAAHLAGVNEQETASALATAAAAAGSSAVRGWVASMAPVNGDADNLQLAGRTTAGSLSLNQPTSSRLEQA